MHKLGDVLRKRYKLVRAIGKGGSGSVFLAEDLHLYKSWAVKVIDLSLRFGSYFAVREIELLKSIDNPHFPKIIDAWVDDEFEYIVSDYIDGISLSSLLLNGPVSKNFAYKIAYQIGDALKYLHNNDPPILYLDLKPDNILIKSGGDVYLIDFGISGAIKDGIITSFGTPGYASPEQYSAGPEGIIDERADIFSFGVTYFVMRTALNPNDLCGMYKNKLLSYKERRFVSKCTDPVPTKRYKSISLALDQLNHINNNFPITSRNIFILIIFLFIIVFAVLIFPFGQKRGALDEMITAIEGDVVDNGYTPKGLRIICNYINSGKLPYKDEQYYCFEVARDYFENYSDYREAKRYFEMLDDSLYPEKEYYLYICNLQTGFDYDEDVLRKCLLKFENVINSSRDTRTKYENLLFLSFCYDAYLFDEDKARSILDDSLFKLCKMCDGRMSEDWISEMKDTYENRRNLLNE